MNINLVETKTKNFFNSKLKNCYNNNFRKTSIITNIIIFILFTSFISSILYYRYRTKSHTKVNKIDNTKMRHFLLNKMRKFNKNKIKSDLITNLPVYNNDFNPRIL